MLGSPPLHGTLPMLPTQDHGGHFGGPRAGGRVVCAAARRVDPSGDALSCVVRRGQVQGHELDEAAWSDGCGRASIWVRWTIFFLECNAHPKP